MENQIFKKVCRDQSISNLLNSKLNEQRKSGKNCDIKLKTEDDGEFGAHRIVLEAVCPFFAKMFNSEFNDKNADSVLIRRCSSSVLEKIIEFMYIGKVEITSDVAREVLDTALFLGLMSLVDTCTEVLVETVNEKNCFELLGYSETYISFSGVDLMKRCIEEICKNIQTKMNSSEFLEMSIDAMKTLCSCDRSLCNDEQLYLAIVRWIQFDMANRKKFISVLLDKINFGEISLEFGISKILKDDSLWEDREYRSKVNEIISKNLMQQLEKDRNQKIIHEVKNLYAVIGHQILSFDPGLKPFSKKITEICTESTGCGSSTFGDKNLFVCGGLVNDESTNSCNYYSFKDDCWKSLPSMEKARYGHRAIRLNNKIYVCGGCDKNTVEIFDINETKWSKGPPLDQDRIWMGLCSYNENIYAVHGSDLHFLDTRSHMWTRLPSLSQNSKKLCSAISYKDLIYGFGIEGIFTFDIRGNKWLKNFTSYEKQYSDNFPVACMINNDIYIFGRLSKSNEKSTYMLHSYEASNLSNYNFQLIKLQGNSLVFDLFTF